jgi:PAS domain S-box-containing protein
MNPHSRKFWRRVMVAGALTPLPGFAAEYAGTEMTSNGMPGWGWTLIGGVTVGAAVAGWRSFRRRRRESAVDRHWRKILAMTDCMVWEAEVRREGAVMRWVFTLLQPSQLYRRVVGDYIPSPERGLWLSLHIPEQAEMDRRSTEAMLSGENGYEQDFRLLADGGTYWLHEEAAIEPAGAGRWRVVAVVTDVTARREAEAARGASEQRLERLAGELHALLWQARVVRRPGGELHWELFLPRSELYRWLFGEEPGAEPMLYWARIGVPEADTMDATAREAILAGRSGYEQEFHVPRPEGDLWLREQVTIREVAEGEWALVGVIVDATMKRLADERRREEEAQFQQLLSAANCLLWRGEVRRLVDGTLLWDVVTSRSLLYQQIFGDPPEGTACRLEWPRVVVPENREIDERAWSSLLSGKSGYTQEFRVLQPGRVLWLHEQVTITPTGPDSWRLAGVVVDITARRAAEEAQRTHQQQLAQIFAAVDCMLWQARVSDRGDGAMHWAMFIPPSRLYREIFGDDDQPAGNFHWEKVVDAATDVQIDGVAMQAIRDGERGYMQEFQARCGDRVRWLHEQVSIERLGDGQWDLVGVITDSTPRHEVEAAKQEHQQQLDKIFDVADCLLWRAEVEEREDGEQIWLVYVPGSNLYHKLFGPAEPDPRTALDWDEAGVPESPEMQRRSAEAIRSGATGYEQEFRAFVEGKMYWLFERVSIKRAAYNRLELVGVIVDVTALKRVEAELAAEKERLAVTLRAMAESVITTDIEGRVRFLNPAAVLLTHWDVEAAVGRPVAEICSLCEAESETVVPVPLDQVLRGDAVAELPAHTMIAGRTGAWRAVEGCCAPIHAADSKVVGMVLVLRDITERERLEQELVRASKLESIGLLAGGIAHDFNNILTAVMGNIALGLLDAEEDSDLGRSLRDAERAALRARDLTQQLLTFARGGEPIRAAVRLPEIVAEMTRFALHGAKVKAELDLAPDLWPADVDKAQIGRVVQNLVINAAQAMPAGGVVRIAARNVRVAALELPPLAPGAYVHISVTDAGVGIRPEHLARVFDPYFTTKQTGSGLGLATVYSIVRKHKGHIRVESVLGRGTTFHAYLPAAEHGLPVAEAGAAAASGALSGRVLFMDDEAPIRQLATTLLSRLGCEIEATADGQAAVDRFRAARDAGRPFDVVVMDLTVPGGMGGLEALQGMRAIDPQVKAIVSSGYSSDPVLANYRSYGFRGRVAKPYELAEFGRVLGAVLGGQ